MEDFFEVMLDCISWILCHEYDSYLVL